MEKHKGSCSCGAVRFEIAGRLANPDACHCRTCRKSSGHFFVSSDVPKSALTLHGAEHLSWYASSDKVRRGFCRTCGASLFWDPVQRDWIGVASGAFDTPTGTRIHVHVHAAGKGDYYDLGGDIPVFPRIPPRPA